MARSRVNSKSLILQCPQSSTHENKWNTTYTNTHKPPINKLKTRNALPKHHIHVDANGEAQQKVDRVSDVLLPVTDVLLILALQIASQTTSFTNEHDEQLQPNKARANRTCTLLLASMRRLATSESSFCCDTSPASGFRVIAFFSSSTLPATRAPPKPR